MKYLGYLLVLVMIPFMIFGANFPSHNGYVNDFVNVITQNDKSTMDSIIHNYEKQTSIEIAVVTIDNLQGKYIEEYATLLFNTWGIGKKGVNDGILILLSLDEHDRRLRIEVGYGLEEFLTDLQCSDIIDNVMTLLKSGDYSTALLNTLIKIKETVGNKSKEIRNQYVKQQNKERYEQAEKIKFVFITVFGAMIIIIFFAFLYNIYKKRQKRKDSQRKFKNDLLTNIGNLSIQIESWLNYSKNLESSGFFGADDVVRKLVKIKTKVNIELPNTIKNEKNHENILKISKDVDNIINTLNKTVSELQKNKNIDFKLRTNLENKISTLENQILHAVPSAKDVIDRINKNNPPSIWRGFNYSNMDRRIEAFIEKAKQLTKESLNQLDMHEFDTADATAKRALESINNAYMFIQSIFDVEKQLNAGKEQYNKYMSNIPKLIVDAEQAVSKPHVKLSTRNMIDIIKQKYNDLKVELSKHDDKTIDWIVIGALIMSIIDGCTNAIYNSSIDIRDYQNKQEEERRAQKRMEESRRRSYSSSSSNSSSIRSYGGGSFGGGMSGGGGSTGRF